MQIVYIHGLDSNANASKANQLRTFCAKHFPQIEVVVPDLNCSPQLAIERIKAIIATNADTGLVGSSLGGFYATILSNMTGKKAVLLNPSVQSGESLKRFFGEDFDSLAEDYVGHTTPDGWAITKKDIEWLVEHCPTQASYPERLLVIVKKGDELLDYQKAVDFFSQKDNQSHLIIEEGGDHRMSDFETKLPQVVQFLFGLPMLK
ncbi:MULTISPECIES: YqiA/YcfP family alpha/beta fold hydrolase [unclassified Moraxella]|uniref:YqiA/YcfP family alpha/beta fold hydrolase n=1 Tax=unclassified Moraxella TaxID=2685852 RepID=UPI003AF562EE